MQGAGKVFHLDVDAGSKAAGLRRQQPGSPPISAVSWVLEFCMCQAAPPAWPVPPYLGGMPAHLPCAWRRCSPKACGIRPAAERGQASWLLLCALLLPAPCLAVQRLSQQQQQQQQQGELGEQPSGSAQRRPSSGGSSSSGGGVGGASTRARRLSFTGPCGGTAAAPALPAAPSSSSLSSAGTPREETSGRGGLPALSAQPALPEAHPLPERRVRFDSPIKTHGRREEEEAGAGTAPLASPLVPVAPRVGAPPLPPPSALRQASREGTPSRPSAAPAPPLSPAKAAAAAFAAAEARLRRGLAAGGSPTKAAAAAAVPMSELIHSVASLSRAGREPSYRKQNQVGAVPRCVCWAGNPCVCQRDGMACSRLPLHCCCCAHPCPGPVRAGQGCVSAHGCRSCTALCCRRTALQDTCFAFSQYCRPTQALLAALDGHGPHGHAVRRRGGALWVWWGGCGDPEAGSGGLPAARQTVLVIWGCWGCRRPARHCQWQAEEPTAPLLPPFSCPACLVGV